MVTSNQLAPGMTLSIQNKLYRVESSVKVSVPKGAPFIKTTLRDLTTHEIVEKNFKLNQTVHEVSLAERKLEFLYQEKEGFLFLDIDSLDQVIVPASIVDKKVNYLKEGIEVKASFYGDSISAIELPQFLELRVSKVLSSNGRGGEEGLKIAVLETGAEIEVPPFIEVGDVIKVDTNGEYIQRVY
jgi:elongation factor P